MAVKEGDTLIADLDEAKEKILFTLKPVETIIEAKISEA